jgi:hypothetical protein
MSSVDTMLNVALLVVIVCVVYLTFGGNNPLSQAVEQFNQHINKNNNNLKSDFEDFVGCGGSVSSPECTPGNYCFKGSYARTTTVPNQFLQYRDLADVDVHSTPCYKDTNPALKNYPCDSYDFECETDNHGTNRCKWVKK